MNYIAPMFDVLAFVYENYDVGVAHPYPAYLEQRLNRLGFDSSDIHEALDWLRGLHMAVHPHNALAWPIAAAPWSTRVYSSQEKYHLGYQSLRFMHCMDSTGVLPTSIREVVIERAMAARGKPLALEDLKVIFLMVYLHFHETPSALIWDALCEDHPNRLPH